MFGLAFTVVQAYENDTLVCWVDLLPFLREFISNNSSVKNAFPLSMDGSVNGLLPKTSEILGLGSTQVTYTSYRISVSYDCCKWVALGSESLFRADLMPVVCFVYRR